MNNCKTYDNDTHLKGILKTLPDPLVITDPQGNVLFANEASAVTLNMSPNQFLKVNIRQLVKKGYIDYSFALEAAEKKCESKGVFTHFSELTRPDDNKSTEQYSKFIAAIEQLKRAGVTPGMRHICASAGFEYHPEMSLDAVRLGRKLYFDNPKHPDRLVSEVASWRARITDVHLRKAGKRIGYADGFVLPCDTKVALLSVGYGDGLMTGLVRKQAPVLIGGKRAKLLQCCMDMCYVDATDIDCKIGNEATLFGYDANGNLLSGQEIAALIEDEGCTLTAALGKRALRVCEN
jgi:alanine racemase